MPHAQKSDGNITGNEILPVCSSTGQVEDIICFMYVTGVWEGIKLGATQILASTGSLPEGTKANEVNAMVDLFLRVCLPETLDRDQMTKFSGAP